MVSIKFLVVFLTFDIVYFIQNSNKKIQKIHFPLYISVTFILIGYFEEAPPSCPTAQTPLLSSASQRDRTTSNTSTIGQIPTCAICVENQRDVIFNCGHLVCCNICATTLQNSGSYICPSCRRPITSQRRVYI